MFLFIVLLPIVLAWGPYTHQIYCHQLDPGNYDLYIGCIAPDAFKSIDYHIHNHNFAQFFVESFPGSFSRGFLTHILQDSVAHRSSNPYLIPDHNRILELAADTLKLLKSSNFSFQHLTKRHSDMVCGAWNLYAQRHGYPSYNCDLFWSSSSDFIRQCNAELMAILANKSLYKQSMITYGPCESKDWSTALLVYNKAENLSLIVSKRWEEDYQSIIDYISTVEFCK
ncbi:hypothetical protein GEMRC1_001878 [Eukaryota sp. GEM-RC1]